MIYFDAAATTLEKPESVKRAVAEAVRTMSSPGRGQYPASRLAEETAYHCREAAAELFGLPGPENVVFTSNATHGLNIAVGSLVRPGSRVVISGYEHNAVTRPLHAIPRVRLTVVDTPLFDPEAAVRDFERAVGQGADVVICNHVSNVFGYVLPLGAIADCCRRRGVPLIVDASQSAGVLPVRMDELGAAFIAMPGHKGLYGPQGTGLLLCGSETVRPVLYGGTGSASRQQQMPHDLPDRLEAGTHNMPGIAGLLAGLRFVRKTGPETISAHERRLCAMTREMLRAMPGVQVYASDDPARQAGVLSFVVEGRDCEEVGEALARRGVAVRAGLHCAPLAHRSAGTLDRGTVRVSFSAFNTPRQVEGFHRVLTDVLRENVTF